MSPAEHASSRSVMALDPVVVPQSLPVGIVTMKPGEVLGVAIDTALAKLSDRFGGLLATGNDRMPTVSLEGRWGGSAGVGRWGNTFLFSFNIESENWFKITPSPEWTRVLQMETSRGMHVISALAGDHLAGAPDLSMGIFRSECHHIGGIQEFLGRPFTGPITPIEATIQLFDTWEPSAHTTLGGVGLDPADVWVRRVLTAGGGLEVYRARDSLYMTFVTQKPLGLIPRDRDFLPWVFAKGRLPQVEDLARGEPPPHSPRTYQQTLA